MKIKQLLLVFVLLGGFSASVVAQDDSGSADSASAQEEEGMMDKASTPHKTWSLGAYVGPTFTNMDIGMYDWLPAYTDNLEIGFGAGLHLSKALGNLVEARLEFNYSQLRGTLRPTYTAADNRIRDLGMDDRGVWLDGTSMRIGISGIFNFSRLSLKREPIRKPQRWNVYGVVGFGMLIYDAEIKNIADDELYDGTFSSADRGVNEVDQSITNAINAGMGFSYRLSPKFDLFAEGDFIFAFADNLDGQELDNNDQYFNMKIGANFNFAFKKDVPAETTHLRWMAPSDALVDKIDEQNSQIADLEGRLASLEEKEANRDTDGDGIPDSRDADPFSNKPGEVVNENIDWVDENGRPIDRDNDGVPDRFDEQLNTPAGDLVNFRGQSLGGAGGGEPGQNGGGRGGSATTVNYASDVAYFNSVYFSLNSANLTGQDYITIARVARAMKANPGINIRLVGHADPSGPEDYNQRLAQQRAQAVKDALVNDFSLAGSRISIDSKGETDVLSSSKYLVNRRVDIIAQ